MVVRWWLVGWLVGNLVIAVGMDTEEVPELYRYQSVVGRKFRTKGLAKAHIVRVEYPIYFSKVTFCIQLK